MIILRILKFTGQLLLLWLIYQCGNQLVLWLDLPLPGTVAGMLLLFGLLSAGVIKVEQIQVAADFLLRHMLFFFIPFAVGLMNWGGLFLDNALVLAAAIVIGAVIPLFAVGRLGQKLSGSKKRCRS